jgi:hypothetical protein
MSVMSSCVYTYPSSESLGYAAELYRALWAFEAGSPYTDIEQAADGLEGGGLKCV